MDILLSWPTFFVAVAVAVGGQLIIFTEHLRQKQQQQQQTFTETWRRRFRTCIPEPMTSVERHPVYTKKIILVLALTAPSPEPLMSKGV